MKEILQEQEQSGRIIGAICAGNFYQNNQQNGYKQEPITRSLHTNCTLESTLSCIFLFLELRYVGGSLIFRKKMLMFAQHPKKNGKFSALFAIIEILLSSLHVT